MIFLSRNPGYNIILGQPKYHIYPDGSREQTEAILEADFSDGSIKGQGLSADGVTQVSLVRGGAFDTDETANRLGWSPETKAYVEERLMQKHNDPAFNDFWLHEAAKAELPWPTYDETHHLQVAKIAAATGTVDAALAYERENKNRDGIVKQLEAERDSVSAEEELSAA